MVSDESAVAVVDVLTKRIRELEAGLRDLLDDLSEDVGQRHHRDKYRVYQVGPQTIEAARKCLTQSNPGGGK